MPQSRYPVLELEGETSEQVGGPPRPQCVHSEGPADRLDRHNQVKLVDRVKSAMSNADNPQEETACTFDGPPCATISGTCGGACAAEVRRGDARRQGSDPQRGPLRGHAQKAVARDPGDQRAVGRARTYRTTRRTCWSLPTA